VRKTDRDRVLTTARACRPPARWHLVPGDKRVGSATERNGATAQRRPSFMTFLDQARLVQRGWVDKVLWAGQVARAPVGVFDGLPNFDAAVTCEMWLRTLEMPREDFPDLQAVPALEAS